MGTLQKTIIISAHDYNIMKLVAAKIIILATIIDYNILVMDNRHN